MPTIKFTARRLDALKQPAKGRIEYWDADTPGLGLRISDRGRRTWTLMYRVKGRQRRMTLGTYPSLSLADARKQARDHLRDVAHGKDPAAHKKAERHAETFADLAELYLEKHARPKKRSWETDRRMIQHDLNPAFGHWKISDIRRRDVIALMDKIASRGAPIMANRTLEVLRMICNFAITREIIEHNPCIGAPKPGVETQREKVLNENEIRAVWRALDAEPPEIGALFRLRLLTAQRGGEVLRLRWPDLDFDAAWWTIPGEFSKNGKAHRVPLTEPTLKILRNLQSLATDLCWVFPGSKRDGPIANIWKFGDRVRRRSKVNFVPHDLRRTAASYMTSMGISRLVVGKILNHAEPGITAVYDRYSYDREKRQALETWASRLKEIVSRELAASNVLSLSAVQSEVRSP